jgi:hypothetical protein
MVESNSKETQSKCVTVNVNLPAALSKLEKRLQQLVDLVSIGVRGVRKVEETEYKVSPFAAAQQLAEPLPYSEVKDEYLFLVLR